MSHVRFIVFIFILFQENIPISALQTAKDPDQTPRIAASDQGMLCLPLSLL